MRFKAKYINTRTGLAPDPEMDGATARKGIEEGWIKRCGAICENSGTSPEQNFSIGFVEDAIVEGWGILKDGALTLNVDPEPLVYEVLREPGYYRKSTGERIPVSSIAWTRMRTSGKGDMTAREVRAWLAQRGADADDYEATQAYECVLRADIHERMRAVRSLTGNVVSAQLDAQQRAAAKPRAA